MSLQQRLLDEMKQAMKAKDSLRLDVIRLLRSRIKNVEIDQGKLDENQVQQIVQQQIKQWQDALQDYKQGQREDLISETKQKIKILQEYLPEQLTDKELTEIIQEVQQEAGLDQIGPLIGQVKQQVGNRAAGARIADLVKQTIDQS